MYHPSSILLLSGILVILSLLPVVIAQSRPNDSSLVKFFSFDVNDPGDESVWTFPSGITRCEDRFKQPNSAIEVKAVSFLTANINTLPFGNTPRTVSAWISTGTGTCPSGPQYSGKTILQWGDPNGPNQRWNFAIGYGWGPGIPSIGINGYYNDFFIDTPNIYDNIWHFMVATFNGTLLTLYLDNKIIGTYITTYATSSTNNFYLFKSGDGSLYEEAYEGKVDDIRIYSRALTRDEISSMYFAFPSVSSSSATASSTSTTSLSATASGTCTTSSSATSSSTSTVTSSPIPTTTTISNTPTPSPLPFVQVSFSMSKVNITSIITDGGITIIEQALLQTVGSEAISSKVLSLCTILPRSCPYDVRQSFSSSSSSFSGQRRLQQGDRNLLEMENIHRNLQTANNYVQVTAEIIFISPSSAVLSMIVLQTSNMSNVLHTIDTTGIFALVNVNPVSVQYGNQIILGTILQELTLDTNIIIIIILGCLCLILLLCLGYRCLYRNKGNGKVAPLVDSSSSHPIVLLPTENNTKNSITATLGPFDQSHISSNFVSITGNSNSWTNNYCIECRTLLPSTANFCPKCGKEKKPMVIMCPGCHSLMQPMDKFCMKCGIPNPNPSVNS